MHFLFLVRCPRGWRARCIDHAMEARTTFWVRRLLLYHTHVNNFDFAYLLLYIFLEHEQSLFASNGANLVDLTITSDQRNLATHFENNDSQR